MSEIKRVIKAMFGSQPNPTNLPAAATPNALAGDTVSVLAQRPPLVGDLKECAARIARQLSIDQIASIDRYEQRSLDIAQLCQQFGEKAAIAALQEESPHIDYNTFLNYKRVGQRMFIPAVLYSNTLIATLFSRSTIPYSLQVYLWDTELPFVTIVNSERVVTMRYLRDVTSPRELRQMIDVKTGLAYTVEEQVTKLTQAHVPRGRVAKRWEIKNCRPVTIGKTAFEEPTLNAMIMDTNAELIAVKMPSEAKKRQMLQAIERVKRDLRIMWSVLDTPKPRKRKVNVATA